jgi:hypothetical protein
MRDPDLDLNDDCGFRVGWNQCAGVQGNSDPAEEQFHRQCELGTHRFHTAAGDTWPLTWASDGNLYGSAGDNQGSPMKFLEY